MGGELISGQNMLLSAGNDINLLAAQNLESVRQYHKETSIGLTVSVEPPVASNAVNAWDKGQAAIHSVQAVPGALDNPLELGSNLWNAGSSAWSAVSAAKKLTQPELTASVSASFSTQSSRSPISMPTGTTARPLPLTSAQG